MSKTVQLADKLTLAKDLGPSDRDIRFKGRIRQAFSAVGGNFSKSFVVNLLIAAFALPFIILFIYFMPRFESKSILDAGYNFSGGIGIGYGVVDNTAQGIALVYGIRLKCFLYFLTPCAMLLGIGLAGAYHVLRNVFWGTDAKIFKHFFRGIRLHWWKFLISFTYLGLVATSCATSLILVLRDTALLGSANAGYWIWMILSFILGFASLMYMTVGLPMYVQYRFKFSEYVKNTSILSIILALTSFIVTAVLALPFALCFAGGAKYFVYIIFLVVGVSFYIMCSLSYGQYVCDNFIGELYEYNERVKLKEAAKSQKGVKGKKAVAVKATAPAAEDVEAAKQQSANGAARNVSRPKYNAYKKGKKKN